MELELRINGVVTNLDVAANESLATLLRREGYCSVKQGCESGECGACTVLVDGVPRPSCVMLAAQAGGCTLTTIESLSSARQLHPLQQAFVDVGAVQCGFCTSGMLLSAYALLKRNPRPTEDEVRDALSGNLCRCTGYVKPVQAVLRAAAIMRGETAPPLEQSLVNSEGTATSANGKNRAAPANLAPGVTAKIPALSIGFSGMRADAPLQVVGKSVHSIDAARLVTGRSAFATDIRQRGMLYGRILTSPHAHAIIRDIDVSEAKTVPGLHAVLTYKDVPRMPYSSVEQPFEEAGPRDQYALDYIMRYVGDRVAVVAAETPEAAEQAIERIHVTYDVLPALLHPRQALEAGAPRLHPESESQGIFDASRNIAAHLRSDVGNVESGFAEADLVVEGEYLVPPVQQAPIERHSVITYFDEDDYLVVRTSTQAPHHVRRTLAQILNIPARRIRVVKPDIGGGFGVKQGIMLEDLAALLTVATNRPVMLAYSRADEFRSGGARQQYVLRIKTGVKRDGTIVANQIVLLAGTGAHATHPLIAQGRSASEALSLYPAPHMRFAAEVLYTNLQPSGAFRGYSSPQEFFALECHMDEVARQLDMDALELRRKNWIKAGDEYPHMPGMNRGRETSLFVESCGLPACAQLVEEKLNWKEQRGNPGSGRMRRGVGMALSLHGGPAARPATSGAIIKLNEDGSFDVFAGANDSGSDSATLLAQIAAEVLGVSIDNILMHTSTTDSSPSEVGIHGSSSLAISGGAVKKAAEQVRRQLLAVGGRMLNVLPEALKINAGVMTAPNGQSVTIAQAAMHSLYVENRHIMTTASWKGQHTPASFAAQGVEVEVDTETGQVRVLKAISAVDAGRVINPSIAEGQIQGSAAQGLGAGVCEELIYDQQGQLLTTSFLDYRIYSAPDMPEMQTYLVESSAPSDLFGAKAVAEIPLNGMAPALANAVADALGVRIRQLPLTPERVLRAIHAQAAKR